MKIRYLIYRTPLHLLNYRDSELEGCGIVFDMQSHMFFTEDDDYIVQLIDTASNYYFCRYNIRAFKISTAETAFDYEMDGGFPGLIVVDNVNKEFIATMNLDNDVIISSITSGALEHKINIGECVSWRFVKDNDLIVVRNDAVYRFDISNAKWDKVIDKRFDMMRVGNTQVVGSNIILSARDTIFLYDNTTFEMKSFLRIDTSIFDFVELDKHKDNVLMLVSSSKGTVTFVKHNGISRKKTAIVENSSEALFIGDSVYVKLITDNDTGWTIFSSHRVSDDKIITKDSIKDFLMIHDVSPNGRNILITCNSERDRQSLEWKVFDIYDGVFYSVGSEYKFWRYPFFYDDSNIVCYGTRPEIYKMFKYNIKSNDSVI